MSHARPTPVVETEWYRKLLGPIIVRLPWCRASDIIFLVPSLLDPRGGLLQMYYPLDWMQVMQLVSSASSFFYSAYPKNGTVGPDG